MIGITIGISLVIIANNSNKEKKITFHDERAERAVPAVTKSFSFLRLSMKASPVNQSQIWNFLSFLPFLTVLLLIFLLLSHTTF